MLSLPLDREKIMEMEVAFLITAVFLTIIALCLSIISWFSFRRIDDKILRAKAFLNIEFQNRNFILFFMTVVFVGLHTLLEFIEIFGYPSMLPFAKEMRLFYFLTLTISMILLVVLAYCWYKLVCYQKPTIIKTPQEIIEEKRIKNPLLNPDEKTLF